MPDKSKRKRTTRRDFMAGILAGGMGVCPARLLPRGERSTTPPGENECLSIQVEEGPNPWTHLDFNNHKTNFQFAILGDQTGYIDWEVFKDSNGWEGIEAALQGRQYTVLAGHTHTHDKIIRKGQKYITLATTGGGKNHAKKGPHVGDFDHITWCTMKEDGPVFANIEVEGIWDEDVYSRERAHFVKTVIGKNFSIACSPVRAKTDTFMAVTAELILENKTEYPMTLEGHFQQHDILMPFPYTVETDMPAHSKKVVPLQISSQSEVPVRDLKPLLFKRVVYCRPDSRPKIPYQDTLEIKIEATA